MRLKTVVLYARAKTLGQVFETFFCALFLKQPGSPASLFAARQKTAGEKGRISWRKVRHMQKFDYLIVGSGLFGSVFAHEATKRGKRCLVIDKRPHIGGNIYTREAEGIYLHEYGAHIFHTANTAVWQYINRFSAFNHYINSPVANFKGELYNLPFNMNTFSKMWGVITPQQAQAEIARQQGEITGEPKNLEEQAIRLVGRDIYEKLIKGYTEKQWGRLCTDLPAFIIKRLPVRYTFDNNYFNDPYQGIPQNGYTAIIEKMLAGSEVMLNTDFFASREKLAPLAGKIVYTGMVDQYFHYTHGHLAYRSLRFETERLETGNAQGVAVVNYTDRETPFTRIIEHKHFTFSNAPVTYVTREYPSEWQKGDEPYYPVNDGENAALYERYALLAKNEKNVIFGGRLAQYKYYDMDKTVEAALAAVETEFSE